MSVSKRIAVRSKFGLDEFLVHKAVYHRNGVSGVGFYAVTFSFRGDGGNVREALATVSTDDLTMSRNGTKHDPQTRVLVFHNCVVNIEETMRGDYFHERLCKWLISNEDANDASYKKSKPS